MQKHTNSATRRTHDVWPRPRQHYCTGKSHTSSEARVCPEGQKANSLGWLLQDASLPGLDLLEAAKLQLGSQGDALLKRWAVAAQGLQGA